MRFIVSILLPRVCAGLLCCADREGVVAKHGLAKAELGEKIRRKPFDEDGHRLFVMVTFNRTVDELAQSLPSPIAQTHLLWPAPP